MTTSGGPGITGDPKHEPPPPRSRRRKFLFVILAAGVIIVAGAASISAFTDSITLETGHVSDETLPVTANDLKPSECAGITVDTIVAGGASISGTDANSLLLADGTTTSITGGNGNDCLVGTVNTTNFNGGGGTNVCIGYASATITFDPSCGTQIRRP